VIVLALITGVMTCTSIFGFVYLFVVTSKQSKDTNAALCTLRNDLQIRVNQTEEFLRENPDGLPGIPRAALDQSLTNQRNTIKALEQLECPPPDIP
jgi:hypothetical protein